MLLDTISTLEFISGKFVPIITYYPKHRFNDLKPLIIEPLEQENSKLLSSIQFVPQTGDSFNDRFQNAFKFVFHDLDLNSALILGSDTPHIQPSIIQTSIQLLKTDQANSVLGPSQRGGFYLLGHNKPFHDTIGNIFAQDSPYRELGAAMDFLLKFSNVHLLPEVTDVDLFEDLKTIRSIIHLLSLNHNRKKTGYFPKHTNNVIKTLEDNIWND